MKDLVPIPGDADRLRRSADGASEVDDEAPTPALGLRRIALWQSPTRARLGQPRCVVFADASGCAPQIVKVLRGNGAAVVAIARQGGRALEQAVALDPHLVFYDPDQGEPQSSHVSRLRRHPRHSRTRFVPCRLSQLLLEERGRPSPLRQMLAELTPVLRAEQALQQAIDRGEDGFVAPWRQLGPASVLRAVGASKVPTRITVLGTGVCATADVCEGALLSASYVEGGGFGCAGAEALAALLRLEDADAVLRPLGRRDNTPMSFQRALRDATAIAHGGDRSGASAAGAGDPASGLLGGLGSATRALGSSGSSGAVGGAEAAGTPRRTGGSAGGVASEPPPPTEVLPRAQRSVPRAVARGAAVLGAAAIFAGAGALAWAVLWPESWSAAIGSESEPHGEAAVDAEHAARAPAHRVESERPRGANDDSSEGGERDGDRGTEGPEVPSRPASSGPRAQQALSDGAQRRSASVERARMEPSRTERPRTGRARYDREASDRLVRRARGAKDARALELYAQALELHPRNPDATAGLAQQHLRHGRLDDALEWAQRTVELRPRRASYRVLLGDVHRAAGDGARAHDLYRRALRMDPDNRFARRRLGR